MAYLPRQRLEKRIASNLDVRWREVCNDCIRSTKHHILASSLQVVVGNLERARTIPSRNRLSVVFDILPIRQVGIDHCLVATLKGNTPLAAGVWITVDVAAV